MIKPIVPENLLEVGNYKIVSSEDDILVVDDWYKNFDELYDIVTNIPAPRWKWSDEGRNFKDYYDCRTRINFNFTDTRKIDLFLNEIKLLINTKFNLKYPINQIKPRTGYLEFNLFKNLKKDVPQNLQHTPHIDGNDDKSFNCIIYIDKICSGGTALYRKYYNNINDEHMNLLTDVSSHEKLILQAKQNRMVIFNSNIYHGGYIRNHNDYLCDWRINQVFIFDSM